MAASSFGAGDFLLRIAFALALVLATFNPTGWSYVHWLAAGLSQDTALKALAGVVLAILYVICLRATVGSIGVIGAALVAALIGAVAWVMADLGVLSLRDPGATQWLTLLILGAILGVGLSWSHIRRRISGQVDIDDVED